MPSANMRSMLAVLCPACQQWAQRSEWTHADGQRIPFRLGCPGCGADHDVSDLETRLAGPPAAEDGPPLGVAPI